MAANTKRKKSKNRGPIIAVTIFAIALLTALLVWLVGELIEAFNDSDPSQSLNSTTPSTALSSDERTTVEIVEGYIQELLSKKEIAIYANSASISLNAYLAGAPVNYAELEAYMESKGANKALVGQYRTILAAQNILEHIYDYNYIDGVISELAKAADTGYDTTYTVTDTGVLFVRGVNHNVIYPDELKEQIIAAFERYDYGPINARIGVMPYENPDISAIREEIYIQAQDAYYDADEDNNTFVVPEVIGRDIDVDAISDGLANGTWTQMLYEFKAVAPEIVTTNLADQYFNDVLSEYTTTYSTSNVNRSINVKLAADAINGNIILHDRTFSFNRVVGRRTAEKGYKEAYVYTNHGLELGLGGGICQVSSTVYVSALMAGIERHTRAAHMYTVDYVPLGLDATVAWPYTDYAFRNNTGYPVKIVTECAGGRLTVKIMGTKTSNITVEFKTTGKNGALDHTPVEPEKEYVIDPSMSPGDPERPATTFKYGYIVETWKTLYIDGMFVSTRKISVSEYLPIPQKIKVYVSAEDYAAIMASQEEGD